ncbi:Pecanex protein-domain-containing protein [Powellomyces hirtus]|nr:Pecanex protein-domain-containing protein [Powellomyces hirtus]
MSAPLLNDDKANLASRRIFRTLSGGPRLAPEGTPTSNAVALWLLQAVVFFLPWIGAVIVYNVWDNDGCWFGSGPNVGYGVIMFLFYLALHIPTALIHENISLRDDEEDEAPLTGPPFRVAYIYSLRNHTSPINAASLGLRVLQTIVSGFLLSACLAYLAPGRLEDRYNSSLTVWLNYTFGWIAVLMAHWSLASCPPPEPNTFYTEDRWHLDVFTRPMYLALILGVAGLEVGSIEALIWMVLPLLWLTGVTPCLRIFVATAFERGHTTILGAPACLTVRRTIITFLALTIPSLVITAILLTQVSLVAGCCAAAAAGCLAASRVWVDLHTVCESPSRRTSPLLVPRINVRVEFAWLVLRTALTAGVIAAVAATRGKRNDELEPASDDDHPGTIVLLIIVASMTLLALLTRELQSLYVPSVIPIFRNPLRVFRSSDSIGEDGSSTTDETFADDITWGVGILYMTAQTGLPFMTMAYILSRCVLSPPDTTQWAWATVVMVRAFRYSWMRPVKAGIIVCIVAALDTGLWTDWRILHVGTRLLIVTVVWEAAARAWWKLGFWAMTLGSFLTQKKERRPNWFPYLIVSLITAPPVILISSVLDAPMMPVLGTPIFWMGFPRPTRFWPSLDGDYTPSSDSHLYATLLPTLLPRISYALALGRIPSLDPSGNVLLARLGSRLLLIRCVESYFEGPVCVVTGGELEPTSCHAREGVIVDNLLEDAFSGTTGWINKNMGNTLQPTSVVVTDAYTDTRSVTSGVLDSNAALRQIPDAFLKALVWLLIKDFGLKKVKKHVAALPQLSREALQSSMGRFPTKWYDFITFLEMRTNKDRPMQTPRTAEQRKIVQSAIVDMPGDEEFGSASRDSLKRPNQRRLSIANLQLSLQSQYLTNIPVPIASPPSATSLLIPDQDCLLRFYRGDLPVAPASARAWLTHPDRVELRSLVLLAARYSVRTVFERAGQNGAMNEAFDVSDTLLKMYHTRHHTSLDPSSAHTLARAHAFDTASTPSAWQAALESKTDLLFGLAVAPPSAGYTGTRLTVRTVRREKDVACWVGTINGEGCKGIWANLVLELLYLTNDDDERYSIQAHESLLRNLTVQTANPPLGYPLYVSQATMTLPFPGQSCLTGMFPGARKRTSARVHATGLRGEKE